MGGGGGGGGGAGAGWGGGLGNVAGWVSGVRPGPVRGRIPEPGPGLGPGVAEYHVASTPESARWRQEYKVAIARCVPAMTPVPPLSWVPCCYLKRGCGSVMIVMP